MEWVCPKGTHQARVADVSLVQKHEGKNGNIIRVIFQITSLVHPFKVYQVRETYDHRELNMFVDDFSRLAGEEAVAKVFNMNGELMPEFLVSLTGIEVDVEVIHLLNNSYESPFCRAAKVTKRGELTDGFPDPPLAA